MAVGLEGLTAKMFRALIGRVVVGGLERQALARLLLLFFSRTSILLFSPSIKCISLDPRLFEEIPSEYRLLNTLAAQVNFSAMPLRSSGHQDRKVVRMD
jgi:hypothetical protein